MSEDRRKRISETEAEIKRSALAEGLELNPDDEVREGIIEGLIVNEERYGYWACPCRLPSGNIADDQDIICPCEYRDADLKEYGRCYCALYVTRESLASGSFAGPIPERRPTERSKTTLKGEEEKANEPLGGEIKMWRCRICGYLCARSGPPSVCPICRAVKEKFEEYRPC